jgi:hypothetical protein
MGERIADRPAPPKGQRRLYQGFGKRIGALAVADNAPIDDKLVPVAA